MNINASSRHSFQLPHHWRCKQICLQFVRHVFNDKDATSQVLQYACSLLQDICRPEFITSSLRDLFSCYTTFTDESIEHIIGKVDNVTSEIIHDRKVFSAVMVFISDPSFFEERTKALQDYCSLHEKTFPGIFADIFTRNLICDTMRSPCDQLPYFRTQTSGKFVARAFVDEKGTVYDLLGIANVGYDYNVDRCTLVERETGFPFAVPYLDMKRKHASLREIVRHCCAFSWSHGKFDEDIALSSGTKILLSQSWNCFREEACIVTNAAYDSVYRDEIGNTNKYSSPLRSYDKSSVVLVNNKYIPCSRVRLLIHGLVVQSSLREILKHLKHLRKVVFDFRFNNVVRVFLHRSALEFDNSKKPMADWCELNVELILQ